MKIIYHHRTQRKGVEGVHISGVIKGLEKMGHEVIEVALVKEGAIASGSAGEKGGKGRLLRYFAEKAPNGFFRVSEILYNIIAFLNLLAAIKKECPDVIYERYAYFNFSGVLAGKLKQVPVILEVNIITELQDVRKLELHSFARIIEKWVLMNARRIFVVSGFLKRRLIAQGIDKNRIIIQPNAIDAEEIAVSEDFHSSEEGQKNSKADYIVIGFMGRLLPWYRLEELISCFYNIRHKHERTQLMLIGNGSHREQLESMADFLKLKEDMHFIGEVSHEKALKLLKLVDIAVMPSTNMWGSPMKLFEYMGSGIPVVAPDIEVVTSIMSDGVHGKLFSYNDFKSFEKSIEYLIEHPGKRKAMGKAAREHIMNHFTWDHVANKVADVASSLVRSPIRA